MNQTSLNIRFRLALCILFSTLIQFFNGAMGQDFVFASLQGIPIQTAGWNLQGAAKVGNAAGFPANSEIVLTEAINTQSGAIFFNTPINLSECKKWYAEFEFRIFDGTAADGIAFCYLDVPPTGFISGGGIGIPATANGLKVVLDTWLNCGTDRIPKVQVRWGPGYDECNGQPTRNNNDTQLSFIRSTNFNKCRIEYNEGNIKVLLNGIEYLTAFQTFTFAGYFGFTASTGGSTDKHSIKNVRIFTEMPPSHAGVDKEICTAGSTTLGETETPGYVYRWTPSTGLSNPGVSNPTITLTNTDETDINQQYILETAYSDRPGCASKDSVIVKVLAKPRPDFSYDTVCFPGGNIQFTNASKHQGILNTNMTWIWNFGDPASGPANSSYTTNPTHFYDQAGSYAISLSATTAKGCSEIITKNITPIVFPPTAQFTITGDTCSGYNIQFNPQANQLPALPLTYSWAFADGSTSTQVAPIHQYATGGSYNATLLVSNPYCSSVPAIRTIQIRPSPILQIASNIPTPCVNASSVPLSFVSVTNGLPGQGIYAGRGVQGSQFLPSIAGTGTHTLRYTFTANNACVSSALFDIRVIALPQVNAGQDKVSLEAKPVQLEGSLGTNITGFFWAPNQHISNPTIINPIVNPPDNTLYVLTATGEGGCTNQDSVMVTVLPALFIPNAFSPNGDGINDVWVIQHLGDYPGSMVQVFDRYGKSIFISTGYNTPWNGTSNGSPIPAGVYYYIIDPKNGATRRQGSVTIIR